MSAAPAKPWRLILSRKGFDSRFGGRPSPILPDGTLLPLPIPSSKDRYTFRDALALPADGERLVADLTGGRFDMDAVVHLDPDLARKSALRLPGWRPSLGQSGGAQSQLAAAGVGPGDVFLFFGWFRQVDRHRDRWRYVPGAPDLHVIHGWLEVGEVLPVVRERERCLAAHPWIANHPHVANPVHYVDPRNTLYIAAPISRFLPPAPGGGQFRRFSPALQLTAADASRSVWQLPAWFMPGRGRSPLGCHGQPARWSRHGRHCRLRSVPIGQEFVLQTSGRPAAGAWVRDLVKQHGMPGALAVVA